MVRLRHVQTLIQFPRLIFPAAIVRATLAANKALPNQLGRHGCSKHCEKMMQALKQLHSKRYRNKGVVYKMFLPVILCMNLPPRIWDTINSFSFTTLLTVLKQNHTSGFQT
jgi:hypothetical protein